MGTLTASSISTTNIGENYLSGGNVIALYIDGVEESSLALWHGTAITDSMGNIRGMTVSLSEGSGVAKDDEVQFLDKRTGKLIFGGYVKEVTKRFMKTDFFIIDLLVQDYTKLIDSVADGVTEDWVGVSEGLMAKTLIDKYQTLLRTSWDYITVSDPEDLEVNNAGLRISLQTLADINGRVWYIDYNKYLHFFASGDELAPFELSDNPNETTTFKYWELEFTEDVISAEPIRGQLKMWKEGLFAGMTLKITNTKMGWSSEPFLVYEVSAALVAGDMFTDPIFEYFVAFGSPPHRVTDRIPPPEEPPEEEEEVEIMKGQSGTTTANWYSGTASSGKTGADVVTITPTASYAKLHSLWISINNLTTNAEVNVRLYHNVKGTEREIYNSGSPNQENFIAGQDPDGIWIVNGTLGISGSIRCEVQSDNSGDTSKAIDWEWIMEELE